MKTVEPKVYLSTSEGKWRVISSSLPICADTTREQAEACARQFRLTLPPMIWNGDIGAFVDEVPDVR